MAFVARTSADARDVMIDGDSGIIKISPPWFRPRFIVSKRRLVWPNGAQATVYTADEPDQLRGPQHDGAWADELASWPGLDRVNPKGATAWDNLQFGLRLGEHPQCVVTTTPRPLALLRELIADPATVVTRGSTFENIANLAPSFIRQIIAKYKGTRLGRQELEGELLTDVEGALWTHDLIEAARIRQADVPELRRIVVAVDPGPREASKNSETGIVVCGAANVGGVLHAYVLADLSLKASPAKWAGVICKAYTGYNADRVIAENNDGGDLVKHTIHTEDNRVAYLGIRAREGKRTRAEPVAALYEQGRVHHVGLYKELEDQMTNWVPGDTDSPDRMDAAVYGLSSLMLGKSGILTGAPQSVELEWGGE